MKKKKQGHEFVSLQVQVTAETVFRIESGPLHATNGEGRAAWVRKLIMDALDEYDGLTSKQGRNLKAAFRGKP